MKRILQLNPLIPHIIVGILVFFAPLFLLKKKSLRTKKIFLYSMWVAGLLILVVNKVLHCARGEHILANLPLHLCYISLVFFIPMSLKEGRKFYRDFVFYVNAIGAFMALVCPARDYITGSFGGITLTYVAFHFIIVYIPFWMFLWGDYSPKITVMRALEIIGVLFVMSILAHGLNVILVKNGVESANYFWTLTKTAKENVSLLRLFISVVPYDYIYLFVFVAPILAIYFTAWSFILKVTHPAPIAPQETRTKKTKNIG